MFNRHLIDLDTVTAAELETITQLAESIMHKPEAYVEGCKNQIMATLFYEPSTRTQMSFQTAMLRLGGQTIGFDNPVNSSVAKGESLKDTIKVVSGYADLIVLRHRQEGAALAASLFSQVPVINAGDGGHLHPTQTLTDLVTLLAEKGTLSGLTIGVCGDIKHGRTTHSLIKCLSQYKNNSFVLISTKELSAPRYILDILDASGCKYEFCHSLEEAMPELDVLYMTRIQKERFKDEETYIKEKGVYILDRSKLAHAKKDLKILHPLPRVDEITVDVDDDPRAVYFKQTQYGMYARMALVSLLMKDKPFFKPTPKVESTHDIKCTNPNCITQNEPYLPHLFFDKGSMLVCQYCETRQLI